MKKRLAEAFMRREARKRGVSFGKAGFLGAAAAFAVSLLLPLITGQGFDFSPDEVEIMVNKLAALLAMLAGWGMRMKQDRDAAG